MKLSLMVLVIPLLLLTGCSTGVVTAGPDTYFISRSVSGFSTAGSAKAANYRDASAWCASRGLVMVPVSSDERNPQVGRGRGGAELLFRALKPGDPDINRADVESPDTVKRIQER